MLGVKGYREGRPGSLSFGDWCVYQNSRNLLISSLEIRKKGDREKNLRGAGPLSSLSSPLWSGEKEKRQEKETPMADASLPLPMVGGKNEQRRERMSLSSSLRFKTQALKGEKSKKNERAHPGRPCSRRGSRLGNGVGAKNPRPDK